MGAKDWFICYAEADVPGVLAGGPELDRAATDALVGRLFAGRTVLPDPDGTLGEHANPDDDMVYAAVWPGASIVCTSQGALDRPSQLDPRFVAEGSGRTVYVHAMHSVVDWFAVGCWGPPAREDVDSSAEGDWSIASAKARPITWPIDRARAARHDRPRGGRATSQLLLSGSAGQSSSHRVRLGRALRPYSGMSEGPLESTNATISGAVGSASATTSSGTDLLRSRRVLGVARLRH